MTVSRVMDLPDGADVTMVGRIEHSLGDELHRFSDLTGTTTVSINYADEDILSDIDVNEIVEIKGHVKREFNNFYVVVDQIITRQSPSLPE